MSLVQLLKDNLIKLGPGHPLTQTALRAALARHGFRITFRPDYIALTNKHRTIFLRPDELRLVPVMAEMHAHFFQMLQADVNGFEQVLDFTKPRLSKYLRTGLELMAPSIAEDDSMPEYTRNFIPQTGMIVFDLGAHAGLTTIELSQMVGTSGHVYAFEPDDEARWFLLQNLDRYDSKNVTVLDVAVGEHSGEALFSMDGTQAAGFVDAVVYSRHDREKKVRVMTLEDACRHTGSVPNYLKSDIEGAELGMVRGSFDFIRANPMHMAFETHRLRDGSFTHQHLRPLLSSAGYEVEHAVLGVNPQHFLYATPRGILRNSDFHPPAPDTMFDP